MSVEPTGRMRLLGDDGTEYLNQTMGRLVYRNGGTTVAYQGGGVWRGTGNESRMVSPPEFHYQAGTLTLPLVVTNPGDGSADTDGTVRIARNGSRPSLTPVIIEDQVLEVQVTSEYYVAWGTYFQDRIEAVTVTYDHTNDTARIVLADLDIDGDYRTGLITQGDLELNNPSGSFNSTVTAAGSVDSATTIECGGTNSGSDCYTEGLDLGLTPLDTAIDTLVNASEDDDPDANVGSGPRTLDDGSYYSDGVVLDGGDLTLDLADGNVTLFVDGDITLDNHEISVVNGAGTNHTARVYTNGDFASSGGSGGVTVGSGEARRFQMFGTSELHFLLEQSNTGYTGTLYAPRSEPATGDNTAADGLPGNPCDQDICIDQGSGDVKGALVGGPATVDQNGGFQYEYDLRGVQPSLPVGAVLPPPLTFLHVSVNRIEVNGVGGEGSVGLAEPILRPRLTVSAQGSDTYELEATSSEPREYIDSYEWDLDGDGNFDDGTGPRVEYTCSSCPGEATVRVNNTEFGLNATRAAAYPSDDD
jgi:hypothetical protein